MKSDGCWDHAHVASPSVGALELPVLPAGDRAERCERCRFWLARAGECHRHAPAVGPSGVEGVWPVTEPGGWCGEWAARGDAAVPAVGPKFGGVAVRLLLARLAPEFACAPADREALVESLLAQLHPNVRKVVVRVNGLDGQPLVGLRSVARELRMSHAQVQVLLRAGEERLAIALATLASTGN